MKIPLLPDLDLARIAPLATDRKIAALKQLKKGFPPYSYKPLRRSMLDLLNVEVGPLGVVPRTPWNQIAYNVAKASRNLREAEANLSVSAALYNFAESARIVGRKQEFFPLSIGVSEKSVFWISAVIAIDEAPLIPFIDPRRTKKLSREGRRFAFSAMHERIRVADPDYAEVELGILQFDSEGKFRKPKLFVASDVELLDFSTIDSMVRNTYALWAEILSERRAESRRRGTGTTGPLV